MPLWLPEEAAPHLKGFMFINCDKAFKAGLTLRSLGETIRATLNWAQTELTNEGLKAGIDRNREQTLLHKWHKTVELR
jgi:2'-hydroxyisoflavone reductase